MEPREIIFGYAIPIVIVLSGLYLSFKSDILKDSSNCSVKPYSLARTQLMWWTLIILSCFCAYYGFEGSMPENLDNSTLILLGISLGTTTAGRIIDNTEINNNVTRHQETNSGKGFLHNLLSDDNGISVHRFQALVFNVIFGLIFINKFLSSDQHIFVSFEAFELGLMGISSGAYVGLKLNENASSNPAARTMAKVAAPKNVVEDNEDDHDLPDVDEQHAKDQAKKNIYG